jgi:hypothetical protein
LSPRLVVIAIVVALIVGLVAGRSFLSSPPQSATANPNAAAPTDDAAAAASRAMTFTQPKAPAK